MSNGISLPTPQFPADFERVGYYDPNLPGFVLEVANSANYCGVYAWVEVMGGDRRAPTNEAHDHGLA
jgi:hypothetical protein